MHFSTSVQRDPLKSALLLFIIERPVREDFVFIRINKASFLISYVFSSKKTLIVVPKSVDVFASTTQSVTNAVSFSTSYLFCYVIARRGFLHEAYFYRVRKDFSIAMTGNPVNY